MSIINSIIVVIIIITILFLFLFGCKNKKCPTGYYINDNGNCEICPSGYYCPEEMNSKIKCQYNSTSNKGSNSIDQCFCQEGYYFENGECKPCPAGYYCSKLFSIKGCPAGSYSEKNAEWCNKCPRGYYCPGSSDKISCPNNSMSISGSTSINDCICNTGFLKNADGTCTPNTSTIVCTAGNYLNTEGTKCIECPAGYYCPESSEKTECINNSTSMPGSRSVNDCICITGYIKNADGLCISECQCVQGNFITNNKCISCPENYYCPSTDINPIKCTMNSSSISGSNSKDACICNDGYYLDTLGKCIICPAGSYCSNNIKTDCPTEKTSKIGSNNVIDCKCNEGFYLDVNGNCIMCPNNNYCPIGSTEPIPCGNNEVTLSYPNTTSLMCQCGMGYYGTHSNCTLCPAGYYCPEHSTYPLICSENSTSVSGKSSLNDCICKDGYYQTIDSVTRKMVCNICQAGYKCSNNSFYKCGKDYISTIGQSTCIPCDPNQISNLDNTKCLTKYYIGLTYRSYSGDLAEFKTSPNGYSFITHRMAIDTSIYPEILTNFSQGFDMTEIMYTTTVIEYKLVTCKINNANVYNDFIVDTTSKNGYLNTRGPLVIYRTSGSPHRLILYPTTGNGILQNDIVNITTGRTIGRKITFNANLFTGTDGISYDFRLSAAGSGEHRIKYLDFDINFGNTDTNGYNAMHLTLTTGLFNSKYIDTYILLDKGEVINGILRINFYMDTIPRFDISSNLNSNAITF